VERFEELFTSYIQAINVSCAVSISFPQQLIFPSLTTMDSGDWFRQTPQHGYTLESDFLNAEWAGTDDLSNMEASYTAMFEGPYYSPARSTNQNNGQYGYRARPAPQTYSLIHGGVGGNPPGAVEPVGNPSNAFMPLGNTRQNGANRSWPGLNNPDPRRLNFSPSLEDSRGESMSEIVSLKHRVTSLEDKLAKNGELEARFNELAKLSGLKLDEIADKFTHWEEKFRSQ
jgi:hypothetical protein